MKCGCTIFIPVYNEAAILRPNLRRLIAYLEDLAVPFEIMAGSNGSTDQTVDLLAELSTQEPRLRFFHLPEKGVGEAFKEGLKLSAFDRMITVDMDLSIDLEFIREALCLLDDHDMVIGSKITGIQQRSFLRRAASDLFIRLAQRLLGIAFHDYSIAAKAYRKKIVFPYLPHMDAKTFYVVEIIFRAWQDGRRITEIPVQCVDRRSSRFNLVHEGFYKYGNLLRLWIQAFREYPRRRKW